MTPTREEVIRVARKAGAFLELSTTPEKDMAFLMRFAERFYEAGAAAEREAERKARMSFGELHPANPNATCKCEHWQSCADCHPTAHDKATGEKT